MPRRKRPSEMMKPDPHAGLPPGQREAMEALAGECRYVTVAGCRVLEVKGTDERPLNVGALKALAEKGLVEVVELWVYQSRQK